MAQQINLFDPVFLRPEKHFSARAMAYGLAVVAAALAALYAWARFEHAALVRSAAEHEARVGALRSQYAQAARQILSEDARKALESEALRLEQEIAARRSLLQALAAGEFGDESGVAPYFAALARGAVPGVWLTGAAIGEEGKEVAVRGRMLGAELAARYLRVLGQQDVMRGRHVTELKLERRDRAPAAAERPAPVPFVEFSFVASRVPNAPPRPLEKGAR